MFLLEHKEKARLALELAQREVSHLSYTHRTLFSQVIDLQWVESLKEQEELSEKVDAFVSRFGRLQDHIGEKLIPRFSALLGESPKSLLDGLAFAEKMEWIESAENFISTRKLRNILVHEYLVNAELFLNALQAADKATLMLIDVVNKISQYSKNIDLIN
jgi:hypothetical protein